MKSWNLLFAKPEEMMKFVLALGVVEKDAQRFAANYVMDPGTVLAEDLKGVFRTVQDHGDTFITTPEGGVTPYYPWVRSLTQADIIVDVASGECWQISQNDFVHVNVW